MKVSIFGNRDYKPDSLPYRLLPYLKKKFPEIDFAVNDPNELDIPSQKTWYIIDTVKGLREVKMLSVGDIKRLKKSRTTLHDFDLGMHLLWVDKIRKDTEIRIIGVPSSFSFDRALLDTAKILANLLQENEQHSSCKDRKLG